MVNLFQIDIILSIMTFIILVISVKKSKIINIVIKNYENRNLHEDIKLQEIQDKYYANKNYVESLKEEINNMNTKMLQLNEWFEKEKKALINKENRLKQQKYSRLYNEYKKRKIIEYIRSQLLSTCSENIHLFNEYAIEYVQKIENPK